MNGPPSHGSPSPEGGSAPRVLAFEAAGRALALPAGAVDRVLEPAPARRVPGTPAWFPGLAVVGGRLLPLTDLGAWLGPPATRGDGGDRGDDARAEPADPGPPTGAGARLIELDATLGLAGLLVDRVDGLLEYRDANADELADDDPLERLGPRRPRARAIVAGGAVRALLDPSALLASPAFVDLSAPA